MSTGAVYIVTQDPRYVGLLRTSAERLKTVMPDLPITVFSQFPMSGACYDRVIQVKPSGDGFYDKTRPDSRESPYDQTMFCGCRHLRLPSRFQSYFHFSTASIALQLTRSTSTLTGSIVTRGRTFPRVSPNSIPGFFCSSGPRSWIWC